MSPGKGGGGARGIEVLLPVRTWSEANLRSHWAQRARRAAEQREDALLLVRSGLAKRSVRIPAAGGRLTVRLTRIGPRPLDSDNLTGALKAVRDGVADALKLDDGDPRLEWTYAQRQSREYAVLVEILP